MIRHAEFRFYAELNDFLPPEKRAVPFSLAFQGEQTVKHLIESLGVPHTEVDLILVNGESVDFSRRVAHGDRVSVYPVFEAFDIAPVTRVRPQPLRDTRFVLDVHLGRLAAYLRMLGFDTLWPRDATDPALAGISAAEHRILLTRDRGLLQRRAVTHGHYVHATHPRDQLAEVVRHFDLARTLRPFKRCLRCNALLEPVACDDFRRCTGCGKIYWAGSHYRRMQYLIEHLV